MTYKKAVARIAATLTGPRSLEAIVEEAARLTGRPVTSYTARTVREALSHVNFVLPIDSKTYMPTRLAMDGKAFRVALSQDEFELGQLHRIRLEPFYSVLGEPDVVTVDATSLITAETVDESSIFGYTDVAQFIEKVLQKLDLPQPRSGDNPESAVQGRPPRTRSVVTINLEPLGAGGKVTPLKARSGGTKGTFDLIVRWHNDPGVLVAQLESRGTAPSPAMLEEDGMLANFIYSRLRGGYPASLGRLLLEAYGRLDLLGATPGSSAIDVINRDRRLRVFGGDVRDLENVVVAYTNLPTGGDHIIPSEDDTATYGMSGWKGRLSAAMAANVVDRIRSHPARLAEMWKKAERRFGDGDARGADNAGHSVVMLRKPAHEQLIAEWDASLKDLGLSDRVRKRKVGNLEVFASYVSNEDEGPTIHLLDVDLSYLDNFLFWAFVRRVAMSRSHIMQFVLDVRDFYRFQAVCGHIADARFAEFMHALGPMIAERFELYNALVDLDLDEDTFRELYETLFIGPVG